MVVLAFLKGKYGLAGTFWGFIVVALVIYNLLSILIFNHLFQFSDYANFKLGYTLFFILPFMYLPVVMIAVWNSATCYQGPQIWVISSKAMMGLLMLALVYHAGSYLVSQYSEKLTKADLIALSSTLNKSLPQVIEPNIFFNKTSFENNRFLFQYQVSNKLKSELSIKTFVIAFKKPLKKQVCEDSFTAKILNNGFLLDYQYIDKNNEEIYTFNFKKADCAISP